MDEFDEYAMRRRLLAGMGISEDDDGGDAIAHPPQKEDVEITQAEYLDLLAGPAQDADEAMKKLKSIKEMVKSLGIKGGYATTALKCAKQQNDYKNLQKATLETYIINLFEVTQTISIVADAILAGTETTFKYFKDEEGNPRAYSKDALAAMAEFEKREKAQVPDYHI